MQQARINLQNNTIIGQLMCYIEMITAYNNERGLIWIIMQHHLSTTKEYDQPVKQQDTKLHMHKITTVTYKVVHLYKV